MELRISAKNLGGLAMPNQCPRCAWLKVQLNHKVPYQIFPGIFSSIDSYTKKVVHGTFDRDGCFPAYINGLGKLVKYINPPHYSKYKRLDEASGMTIWGSPDAIFELDDGSFVIGDYKTARFTAHADELSPMYEVQLNAYEYIGETNGIAPVSHLALLYFEPETEPDHALQPESAMAHGFRMGFKCTIKPVVRTPGRIPELLSQVRPYFTDKTLPSPGVGCKDCEIVDAILNLLR